jgi:signal transduction histidine kinase
VFSVADIGPGIPAEHLSHAFDRYWQQEGADRRGSGLGLYIARGIVEAHGGRIWIESTVGRGTTARFRLPTARVEADAAASPPP